VDVSVRDGHFLLDKAPGISLGATPVVALLEWLGIRLSYRHLAWLLTLLLSCLPTVLALFGMRRRLQAETDRVAAAIPAALALATPWTVYAGLLFGHALAAALVTAGALLSLGPLRPGPAEAPMGEGQDRRGRSRHAPLLGGLALGAAVLTEYPAAWVVLVVLGALLADPSRRHRVGWVVLGGLAPALGLATWNQVLFGHSAHFSYAYKWNPTLAATHGHGLFGLGLPTAEGLWGLLLSARRGLLHWAPWLALGVLGGLWTAGDRALGRAWRITLGLGPLGALLLISGFHDWHGGRALGPRYVLFVLPLWGIAGAWALHRMRRLPAYRYALAALLGLVASSTLLTWIPATGYAYVGPAVQNPLFEVVIPVFFRDGFGPTIWDGLLGRPAGALLTVAAAVGAGALLWPRRAAGKGQRATGAADPGTADPETPQPSARANATPHEQPASWRLGLLAFVAAVLHLSLASLPTTAGTAGLARVRRERALAKEVLNLEKGPHHRAASRPPPGGPGVVP
jgi:4-amino-4-deoxy-L-arabinose transferase and related glycosyltransferases of PMT family